MIFELNSEDVTTAIKEYCLSRELTTKPIGSIQFKTSRRGNKGTRAIISTLDNPTVPTQLELPLEAVVEAPEAIPEPVIQQEEEEDYNPPEEWSIPVFKKLF